MWPTAVCDLVSTGSTLRMNDLEPIEAVLRSEAVLIAHSGSLQDRRKRSLVDRLRVRLQANLQARRTKYVMMNAPETALERIKEILPGLKSPTVVPLATKGMIAVHSAVPEEFFLGSDRKAEKGWSHRHPGGACRKDDDVMKRYRFNQLQDSDLDRLCRRNPIAEPALIEVCREIFQAVRRRGDEALREYTRRFDGVEISRFAVSESEFDAAECRVSLGTREALQTAARNIQVFHASQRLSADPVEVQPGIRCWRASRPIDAVGLYVPGGTAVLPSTVLMLGIPARVAGCRRVVLCVPPRPDGTVTPEVLVAARIAGIGGVFRLGGAQAIAALCLGTPTVPRVDKILGPGSRIVQTAKLLATLEGTAIDLIAGPSEVLVIADESAQPDFVAADLLSQSEHGVDSRAVLVSTSEAVIDETHRQLDIQLQGLPRRKMAREALNQSFSLLVESLAQGFGISNRFGPEHLILHLRDPLLHVDEIQSAGSVFLGPWSPEVAGDYASGTNHTLPTSGRARVESGVSLDSFVKKISFQILTRDGLEHLAPTLEALAQVEDLEGHRRAVRCRLEKGKAESPTTG